MVVLDCHRAGGVPHGDADVAEFVEGPRRRDAVAFRRRRAAHHSPGSGHNQRDALIDVAERVTRDADDRSAAGDDLNRFNGGGHATDLVVANRAGRIEEGDPGAEHDIINRIAGHEVAGTLGRHTGVNLDAAPIGVLHQHVLHGDVVIERRQPMIGDDAGAEVVIPGDRAVGVAVESQVLNRDATALDEEAVRHRGSERTIDVAVSDGRTDHHARLRLPMNR